MSANVPGASKRLRSPTQSGMLGWAEYDVDLLDNVRRNKRFAVDVSFSADLASKMSMGGPTSSGAQSPPKSVNRQPAPATAEPISAECSPAATPGTCGAADPGPGGAHPLGWSTPQRPVALGSVAGLSLTSPSDPGLGGYDLRKMALRRVALGMARSRGASMALAPTGGASPGADSGSPMALGAAATPAVCRPRSRLAQPGGQEGVGSATGAAPMDARRSHDTSRMSVGPG